MAELWLKAGMAVLEVARRLGFVDSNSFHRAFRRWSGTTPGAVRRQVR
jgi:AraC-like DNA-binding protein